MKKSLKSNIELYNSKEQQILRHFSKKGYSTGNVAEYASMSFIPLVVIYYFLWKNGEEDAYSQIERLAEYYDLEIDI